MAAKFGVFVDEDNTKLRTLFWLSKLHKRPYKSHFIVNSSLCTTTEMSILLTSRSLRLKTILNIKQQFMKGMVKKSVWSIKNSFEFFNKLKSRGFLVYI